MTEQKAIELLDAEYERPGGLDFCAVYNGFHSNELSPTLAGEWLIDEHGCDEETAYEYSMAWVDHRDSNVVCELCGSKEIKHHSGVTGWSNIFGEQESDGWFECLQCPHKWQE